MPSRFARESGERSVTAIRFLRVPVTVLLTALAALLAAGCQQLQQPHHDWVIFVSSDASFDVIVRVTYQGGQRDVLLMAREEIVVISLPNPRPPAKVSLLDPKTCAVIASGNLPAEAAFVSFADDAAPGQPEMEIRPRYEGFSGTLPPLDPRCTGP